MSQESVRTELGFCDKKHVWLDDLKAIVDKIQNGLEFAVFVKEMNEERC